MVDRLSWISIALMLTLAPLFGALVAALIWRQREFILGNLAGTVVIFGTAIALGFWANWQGVGIWAGLCAGLIVVSGALVWRFHARDRLGLIAPRAA